MPEGTITENTLGTNYSTSSNFTPGAVEVDAIALKFTRSGSVGTGTMSISLYDATSASEVVAITVPCNDVPYGTPSNGYRPGWALFSLGANYLLEAGKNYVVRLKATANTPYIAYSTGVTNWHHMLRTTTNAAPSTGDSVMIIGLWTAAGTWTQYTVTVDTTSTSPTFGATPSGTYFEERNTGIYVARSTLTWPTTSSTTVSITGGLRVHWGGKVQCGTTASPIERGTTASIYFVSGTGNIINQQGGTTVSFVGQSPHSSCSLNHTTLVLNATSGSTASLTVADQTYWTSGSPVVIANAGYNNYDKHQRTTLSTDAGTNSLQMTSAAIYSFQGSSGNYAGCEIFLRSHNVQINCSTTTFMAAHTIASSTSLTLQWMQSDQFSWYMNSVTSASIYVDKVAFWFPTTSGNSNTGLRFDGSWNGANIFIRDVWTNNPGGWQWYLTGNANTATTASIDGMYSFSEASNAGGVYLYHGTHWTALKKVRLYCGNGPLSGNGPAAGWKPAIDDYLADCLVVGSSNGRQLDVPPNIYGATFNRMALVSGFHLILFSYAHSGLTWKDGYFAGGSNYNTLIGSSVVRLNNILFDGCQFGGKNQIFWDVDAAYSGFLEAKFLNCRSNGNPHTGVFIRAANVGDSNLPVEMRVTVSPDFASWGANVINATSAPFFTTSSFVAISKYGGTAGDYRIFKPTCPVASTYSFCPSIQTDQTVYHTAAPSEKLNPLFSSVKLESSVKRFAVTSGSTASVGVWVYKSAAYNGNQPRLIIKRNDIAGYNVDTTGSVMSTGTGAWENLTTTIAAAVDDIVLEVVVDCDGTTGSTYVDDWTAT